MKTEEADGRVWDIYIYIGAASKSFYCLLNSSVASIGCVNWKKMLELFVHLVDLPYLPRQIQVVWKDGRRQVINKSKAWALLALSYWVVGCWHCPTSTSKAIPGEYSVWTLPSTCFLTSLQNVSKHYQNKESLLRKWLWSCCCFFLKKVVAASEEETYMPNTYTLLISAGYDHKGKNNSACNIFRG